MINRKNKEVRLIQVLSSLQIGGIEKLTKELTREYTSMGLKNIIVIINNEYNMRYIDEMKKYTRVYLLNRKPGSLNIMFLFKLIFIMIKNKINIIHVHNYFSCLCIIPYKILLPWVPVIYTIHHSEYSTRMPTLIERIIHKRLILINVAVSFAVYGSCLKYNFRIPKLIYNGINLEIFRENIKYVKDNKKINIINISRINHKQKGQDILIKAINECKKKGLDCKCRFIGPWEQSIDSYNYLKNMVKKMGLENEIEFVGSVLEVKEVLKAADIYVQPSRLEALAISVIEAQASGVPVITSDAGGLKELVKNKCGLIFKNGDYQELAEKIIELSNSETLRLCLIKNAKAASDKFDIKRTVKEYINIYEYAINK